MYTSRVTRTSGYFSCQPARLSARTARSSLLESLRHEGRGPRILERLRSEVAPHVDGHERSIPHRRFLEGHRDRPLTGGAAVDADHDGPVRVGVAADHDDRAVRVAGDVDRRVPEQRGGRRPGPGRADHHDPGVLGQVDEPLSAAPDRQFGADLDDGIDRERPLLRLGENRLAARLDPLVHAARIHVRATEPIRSEVECVDDLQVQSTFGGEFGSHPDSGLRAVRSVDADDDAVAVPCAHGFTLSPASFSRLPPFTFRRGDLSPHRFGLSGRSRSGPIRR